MKTCFSLCMEEINTRFNCSLSNNICFIENNDMTHVAYIHIYLYIYIYA